MIEQMKKCIRDFCRLEYGTEDAVCINNPYHVDIAYGEDENPPYGEMQVEADLINCGFRYYYDGKLVNAEYASDANEYVVWLAAMDYNELLGGCCVEKTCYEY